MKKIIGLCGYKGTGKDFLANIIVSNSLQSSSTFSIAERVKILAAREESFLEADIKTILANPYLYKKVRSFLLGPIIKKKKEELTDMQILQKVNVFKNFDELTTRQALYDYFWKEKKNWYEHISLEMKKAIRKEKSDMLIVTDTRTLLEAVDILLENGLLINVHNSRSESLEQICFLHFSELELSKKVNWKRIGFAIDVTSRDINYIRKNIEEIIQLFYKNFDWYSSEFIKKVKEFRTHLLLIIPEVEKRLAVAYKEKDKDTYIHCLNVINNFKSHLQELVEEEYQQIISF